MAATFMARATGVAYVAGTKVILSLTNATGSGKIVRVYRIWMPNESVTGATGGNITMNLAKAAISAGTPVAVTPIKYDTGSTNLPAQITASHGNTTVTPSVAYKRWLWSGDEFAVSSFTVDEIQGMVPFSLVWDCGYGGNTNVEPITLRENETLALYQSAGTAAMTTGAEFEFTVV